MSWIVKGLLGLAVMTGGARAEQGPVVTPEPELLEVVLPQAVSDAITRNYEIGRGEWDQGGVSKVRTFSLAPLADLGVGTQAWYRAVVRAVTQATAGDGPAALTATCGLDPESDVWDPIADPAACADWHAQHSGLLGGTASHGERTRHDLGALRVGGSSAEEVEFDRALDLIQAYLYGAPELSAEVVSATDYYSVDVTTTVLIDEKAGLAHVVSYDWGA